MKLLRVMILLMTLAAVFLASVLHVFAIGFDAETVYDSVFVIYSGNALGSGFAIGKNCVVTNAHVITDVDDIYVEMYSGEKHHASVVGMDTDRDVAVLCVSGAEFVSLKPADHSALSVGDDVYTIGAPKSMSYSLTKGIISAKYREMGSYSYIQTDAAINEGNSGGPLLNDSGEVIGVNTMKMTDSEGIGLAIPIGDVCDYIESLGIALDENGNVEGAVDAPDGYVPSTGNNGDSGSKRTEDEHGDSLLVIVLSAIVLVSVTVNIVLVIMLTSQKRNYPVMKIDPRERTDFDIDILE